MYKVLESGQMPSNGWIKLAYDEGTSSREPSLKDTLSCIETISIKFQLHFTSDKVAMQVYLQAYEYSYSRNTILSIKVQILQTTQPKMTI